MSSCSQLYPKRSGGVGTIRPLGSRCRRFGRDPGSVSRVASFFSPFLAVGMDEANPRVSATSSIVRAYKGYTLFYGIIPFARVPDPEVTVTLGLLFALS